MLEVNREEPIALMKDSKSNDKDEGKDYCCATWWKADEISVGEKVQFHNRGFVIAGLIIGPIVTQKEVRDDKNFHRELFAMQSKERYSHVKRDLLSVQRRNKK